MRNCQPKQPNKQCSIEGEILQIYHTFELFGPQKNGQSIQYMLHVWNTWTHIYKYLP